MKAVVMAGGHGSRLRPLTDLMPKPLMDIDGTPVMSHVLRLLRRHGIHEAVVTVRYLADQIITHFGDGAEWGMKLSYAREAGPALGTAGAVRAAADLLDEEDFLVVSADALTDIDLGALAAYHGKNESLATVCLTEVADPAGFGIAELAADGRIERFLEKPGPELAFGNTVNTGIYLMARRILDWVAPHGPCDWADDVFPRLLAEGAAFYGYQSVGYWRDIGTHTALSAARDDVLTGAYRRPCAEEPAR
jgi:NDP-sugar pyrophosphorylase family protein